MAKQVKTLLKEKIEHGLVRQGYVKMLTASSNEFLTYFKPENQYINAVQVVDTTAPSYLLSPVKDKYRHTAEKISWSFMDRGYTDVHVLTILLAEDVTAARAVIAGDAFGWIVDSKTESLCIDEDKTADFYGIKSQLVQSLQLENTAEELQEKTKQSSAYPLPKDDLRTKLKNGAPVNVALIGLNIALFVVGLFVGDVLYGWGVLNAHAVLQEGQWYRLLSATFLHKDADHIFSNMLMLYLLGSYAERALGHIKYLFLYLLSGIGASMTSMLFMLIREENASSLGASGAVFGMIGALLWVTLRNKGQAGVISTPRLLVLIGFSVYAGYVGTNIDNAAHVGGLFFGIVLSMLLYRKRSDTSRNEEN